MTLPSPPSAEAALSSSSFGAEAEPPPGERDAERTPHADAVRRSRPPYVFLAATSAITLAVDALSKMWAVSALEGDGASSIPVLEGNMDFVLRRNTGGAWSLLHDAPEWVRRPFFVLISVVAIGLIVAAYRKLGDGRAAARWGFALVLGGALGNLLDRIRDSAVVDFIRWHAQWGGQDHEWPTFNVADVAIVAGVVLLAIDTFRRRRPAAA